MKTSQWQPSTLKFGKFGTIKNTVSQELEINGRFGFIWQYSDTHYKACILSAAIANKFLKPNEKYKIGDEATVVFPKKDLDIWCKRLYIKNNRNTMVDRADEF